MEGTWGLALSQSSTALTSTVRSEGTAQEDDDALWQPTSCHILRRALWSRFCRAWAYPPQSPCQQHWPLSHLCCLVFLSSRRPCPQLRLRQIIQEAFCAALLLQNCEQRCQQSQYAQVACISKRKVIWRYYRCTKVGVENLCNRV